LGRKQEDVLAQAMMKEEVVAQEDLSSIPLQQN
jgi:hypothetical protein